MQFNHPLGSHRAISRFFRWFVPFLVLFTASLAALRADEIIYDDALENGWQNWGWATLNYTNPAPVHSGSDSVSVTLAGGWQGVQIWHPAMDSTPYTNLSFWVNGGATGGQKLSIYGLESLGGTNNFSLPVRLTLVPFPANTWQQIVIPLSTLGAAAIPNFTGFVLQDALGATQPVFYLDDISLQSGSASTPGTNAPVTVRIDALASRHPISPLIYGVAFATSSQLQDLNAPLHRSGGNGTTTYNWQNNAWNHAADWYFESIAESSSAAGGDGDDFITTSKNGGAQAMLTIPTLGWVAKLGPNRSTLPSYSVAKYGAQTAADPYFSDAGNGMSLATGLNLTNNDPNDANIRSDTNYQAGWVDHLTNQWGLATNGGLRYYLMDNEWSLWYQTHRDVHPIGSTMQEELGKFCDYSTMVKGIDPGALALGPEEWGWPGYLNSGYDLQFPGQQDRLANGGEDFSPWFLNQVRLRSQAAGRRLLDCFTLHIYPAAFSAFNNTLDVPTELLRNQSTRDFWDTNYVDPSWINQVIALIPRMKSWVATNYPGTLTGITEYNWGAEGDMNGATAQADILGIFGREGLDLATRWTTPATGSPVYDSMKIYRNYDGLDSGFGQISVNTAVPNPDELAAYSAVRTNDGALTIMVINKDLLNATPAVLDLANFPAQNTAQVWQISGSGSITRLADLATSGATITEVVPAKSITLLVIPPQPASLAITAGPNPQLQLSGVAGLGYTILASSDLRSWTTFAATNLVGNQAMLPLASSTAARQYFRAVRSP